MALDSDVSCESIANGFKVCLFVLVVSTLEEVFQFSLPVMVLNILIVHLMNKFIAILAFSSRLLLFVCLVMDSSFLLMN